MAVLLVMLHLAGVRTELAWGKSFMRSLALAVHNSASRKCLLSLRRSRGVCEAVVLRSFQRYVTAFCYHQTILRDFSG